MKTRSDIITRACRQIGITAHDEVPDGDTYGNASVLLDGLFAEMGFDFTSEQVEEELFLSVAALLASELAPQYRLPGPSRETSKLRVKALLEEPISRVRDDAVLRAQYY